MKPRKRPYEYLVNRCSCSPRLLCVVVTEQVLYLHMRLNKPDMISGAVSYEQRYSVSSWASEEPVDEVACPDGCTSECHVGGECVELAQGIVTDRVIQCPSNEQ